MDSPFSTRYMFLIEYAPLNCVRELTKWKNKQKVHARCGDTKGTQTFHKLLNEFIMLVAG